MSNELNSGASWHCATNSLTDVPGWMPPADSYPVWTETIMTPEECDRAYFSILSQYHQKQLSTVYQWDGKGSQVDVNARYTHYYDVTRLPNWQDISNRFIDAVQRTVRNWMGDPTLTTSAVYSHQILGYEERCLFRTHADNSINSGRWTRNTPDRDISALLYMSDYAEVVSKPNQFSGGELQLDNIIMSDGQPLQVKPTKGMLLVFPSHPMYVHQVLPITKGYRIALVNWFSVFKADGSRI